MCNTPWCFGDCEECEAEKKFQEDYEFLNVECPYRAKCILSTIDAKTDICTTCQKAFKY